MLITWYGTAAIGIETAGTRLLFDPFIRRNKRLPSITTADFAGFGHILLTHGHFDHVTPVPQILKENPCTDVYCTQTPLRSLTGMGADKTRLRRIAPGDGFTLGDVQVTVLRGKHVSFDPAYLLAMLPRCALHLPETLRLVSLLKKLPENGEIVSFVLRAEGKTVLLLGSYGFAQGETYPENADLMVFPFSGNTGIAETAAQDLARLRPKSLLFDHFDDSFPPLTKRMDAEGCAETLRAAFPEMETTVPTEGKGYEVR